MPYFDCLFLTSTHDIKDDIDIEIGGLDELGSLFGFVHDLLQWLGAKNKLGCTDAFCAVIQCRHSSILGLIGS